MATLQQVYRKNSYRYADKIFNFVEYILIERAGNCTKKLILFLVSVWVEI